MHWPSLFNNWNVSCRYLPPFTCALLVTLIGTGAVYGAVEYNMWRAVDFKSTSPSNRRDHTATLIIRPLDDRQFMLVFGGRSSTAWTEKDLMERNCRSRLSADSKELTTCCFGMSVNETWMYSLSGRYWHQVFSTWAPPARERQAASPTADGHGVVIFGGHSPENSSHDTLFDDVWLFATSDATHVSNNWFRPVHVGANSPKKRYGASLQRITGGSYLLFGGCTVSQNADCSNVTNDLWLLSLTHSLSEENQESGGWTALWTKLDSSPSKHIENSTVPSPRWSHVGAFTGSRRSMLVFGGCSADLHRKQCFSDLHEFVYTDDSPHGYWKRLPALNTTVGNYLPFSQVSGVFNDTIDCLVIFLVFGRTEIVDGQGLFRFCFFAKEANSSGWWSANLLPDSQEFRLRQPLAFNLIGQSFLFHKLEQLLVFGGRVDVFTGEESTSMWTLSLEADKDARTVEPGQWRSVQSNESRPLRLAFHRSVVLHDLMFVVGGRPVASRDFNEGMDENKIVAETLVWAFNLTNSRWQPIQIRGKNLVTDATRLRSNASFLIDFSLCHRDRQMFVFGGFIGDNIISCAIGRLSASLTVFSVTTNLLWTIGRVDKGNGTELWPSARRGHTAVLYKQDMYIFGGVGESSNTGEITPLNDLWSYSMSTRSWSELTPLVATEKRNLAWPAGRFGHTAVVLQESMYIFGGCDNQSELTSGEVFWSFDFTTNTWKNLTTSSVTLPSARYFHAAAQMGDNSFIISGGCQSNLYQGFNSVGCLYCEHRLLTSQSTWLYNVAAGKWEHLQYDFSTAPSILAEGFDAEARAMHSLAALQGKSGREVWMFGGYSQCTGNSPRVTTMTFNPGCPRGKYSQDIAQDECRPCPVATYASSAGQAKCTPCPLFTSTRVESATSIFNCAAKCEASFCNYNGHCHVVLSDAAGKDAVTPKCTSCNFGYKTDDNCDVPTLLYQLLGGIIGVLIFMALATCGWRLNKQKKKQVLQDKQLRTSKQEICELTAAWQIDHSELLLKRRVDLDSPGGFGEVWLGEYCDMKVAVKTVAASQLLMNPNAKEEMENEMALMRTLRHPNIVLFLGGGDLPDSKGAFIVMEYMAHGTLTSILAEKTIHIDREQQLRFALDAAKGMRFLHGLFPPRIHRDLKSSNLLVSERWVVKVADFGTSRLLPFGAHQSSKSPDGGRSSEGVGEEEEIEEPFVQVAMDGARALMTMLASPLLQKPRALSTHVGTSLWRAPELIREAPYASPADVYSFGIVLWEILCREMPFAEKNFRNVFAIQQLVLNGTRPTIPANCPQTYEQLMTSCWADNPATRPTFGDIVSSLEKQLESARLPLLLD